jgi:hypothetical protein
MVLELTVYLLQLLVNKTLYEKTLASGFGSVYFLLDASEQQQVIFIAEQAKHICNLWVCFVRERISLTIGFVQYKEALLAYAMLLCRNKYQVLHAIRLVPWRVAVLLLATQLFICRYHLEQASEIPASNSCTRNSRRRWKSSSTCLHTLVWHVMYRWWRGKFLHLLLVDWDAHWQGYGDTCAVGAGDWASNQWWDECDWPPVFRGIRDPEEPVGWLVGTQDRARWHGMMKLSVCCAAWLSGPVNAIVGSQ